MPRDSSERGRLAKMFIRIRVFSITYNITYGSFTLCPPDHVLCVFIPEFTYLAHEDITGGIPTRDTHLWSHPFVDGGRVCDSIPRSLGLANCRPLFLEQWQSSHIIPSSSFSSYSRIFVIVSMCVGGRFCSQEEGRRRRECYKGGREYIGQEKRETVNISSTAHTYPNLSTHNCCRPPRDSLLTLLGQSAARVLLHSSSSEEEKAANVVYSRTDCGYVITVRFSPPIYYYYPPPPTHVLTRVVMAIRIHITLLFASADFASRGGVDGSSVSNHSGAAA